MRKSVLGYFNDIFILPPWQFLLFRWCHSCPILIKVCATLATFIPAAASIPLQKFCSRSRQLWDALARSLFLQKSRHHSCQKLGTLGQICKVDSFLPQPFRRIFYGKLKLSMHGMWILNGIPLVSHLLVYLGWIDYWFWVFYHVGYYSCPVAWSAQADVDWQWKIQSSSQPNLAYK